MTYSHTIGIGEYPFLPTIPRVLKHILFWLSILIFFTLFGYIDDNSSFWNVLLVNAIYLPQDIIFTYIILYLLIPFLLLKRRYLLFTVCVLGIVGLNIIISLFIDEYIILRIRESLLEDKLISRIYSSLLVFSFISILAISLKLLGINNSIQLKKEVAETRYHKAELALLRSQVNPHFLFNVFNNIDELIYNDKEKASQALSYLSESLRYVLQDSTRDFVPIESEIDFIQSYLKVASISFSDPDFIKFNFLNDCEGREIAPLILIPFVENAVKHCKRSAPVPGIAIEIKCDHDNIELGCRNYCKDNDTVKKHEGFGLSNARKRLDLIYPDKYTLDISKKDSEFIMRLRIYV